LLLLFLDAVDYLHEMVTDVEENRFDLIVFAVLEAVRAPAK